MVLWIVSFCPLQFDPLPQTPDWNNGQARNPADTHVSHTCRGCLKMESARGVVSSDRFR